MDRVSGRGARIREKHQERFKTTAVHRIETVRPTRQALGHRLSRSHRRSRGVRGNAEVFTARADRPRQEDQPWKRRPFEGRLRTDGEPEAASGRHGPDGHRYPDHFAKPDPPEYGNGGAGACLGTGPQGQRRRRRGGGRRYGSHRRHGHRAVSRAQAGGPRTGPAGARAGPQGRRDPVDDQWDGGRRQGVSAVLAKGRAVGRAGLHSPGRQLGSPAAQIRPRLYRRTALRGSARHVVTDIRGYPRPFPQAQDPDRPRWRLPAFLCGAAGQCPEIRQRRRSPEWQLQRLLAKILL